MCILHCKNIVAVKTDLFQCIASAHPVFSITGVVKGQTTPVEAKTRI